MLTTLPIIDQQVVLNTTVHHVSVFLNEDLNEDSKIDSSEKADSYLFLGSVQVPGQVFHGNVTLALTEQGDTIGGPSDFAASSASGDTVNFNFAVPSGNLSQGLNTIDLVGVRTGSQNMLIIEFDVTVDTLNHAPVLDTSPNTMLIAINEDTFNAGGTPAANLTTTVTDANPNAKQGIAVVATGGQNSGQWQFTLNGGANWSPIGAVSDSSARLIPSDSLSHVRFVPKPNFNGQVSLNYRAWDQTLGTSGDLVDIMDSIGGQGATSNEVELATLRVRPVNDAPRLNNLADVSLGTMNEDVRNSPGVLVSNFAASAITDVDAAALKGIAVTGISSPSPGQWQYSLNNGGNWFALGAPSESAARLLPADGATRVRFIPNQDFNGQVKLFYRAWDRTEGAAGTTLSTANRIGGTHSFSTAGEVGTLTIAPVNDPPKITGISGSIGYHRGAIPIQLAAAAIVKDVDSPAFPGGRLLVHINQANAANHLLLKGQFQVDASNRVFLVQNNVRTQIGTRLKNGAGVNDLLISFNSPHSVTPAIAQQLIRSVFFATQGGTAGNRSVVFTLSDGKQASTPVAKIVAVT